MKRKNILKNKRGQGLIEYIIIVAIVSVGAISLVRVLNQSVNVKFAQIASALGAKSKDKIVTPEVTANMLQKKDLTNFMRGVRDKSKNENQSESSENDND